MLAWGMVRLAALILLVLPFAAHPAWAEHMAGLADGGTAVAVAVVDGDTLVLADGREVRLVGIQAPKLPLGRPGFRAWPLAEEAKAALARLALGKRLALGYGGRRTDRHGRALAHLHDPEGRWIQGALLEAGMARVYSFRDNRALVASMLAAERKARVARAGIWGHPFYRVRRTDGLARDIGSFQIVRGRVLDAARVRKRLYLNFGEDWRSDFTVTISARDGKLFETDPLLLEGRQIQVRGWVKSYNGPMIEVSHPEQIEVVAP